MIIKIKPMMMINKLKIKSKMLLDNLSKNRLKKKNSNKNMMKMLLKNMIKNLLNKMLLKIMIKSLLNNKSKMLLKIMMNRLRKNLKKNNRKVKQDFKIMPLKAFLKNKINLDFLTIMTINLKIQYKDKQNSKGLLQRNKQVIMQVLNNKEDIMNLKFLTILKKDFQMLVYLLFL